MDKNNIMIIYIYTYIDLYVYVISLLQKTVLNECESELYSDT